jgi:transmembrane sensor
MMNIDYDILQLAFDLKDQSLTEQHKEICEEWISGKAVELMKVDIDDPRLLEYVAYHKKLKAKTKMVWQEISGLSNTRGL